MSVAGIRATDTRIVPHAITVRPVQPADAAVWEDLREGLWSDERERHAEEIARFFAGNLSEPIAVFLAESETGSIVGLVELSLRSDIPGLLGRRTGYVEGLYVAPLYRFRGVASFLLQHSRNWARQQACDAFASDREDRVIVDPTFSGQSSTEP